MELPKLSSYNRHLADKVAGLLGGYQGDADDHTLTIEATVTKAAWYALYYCSMYSGKTFDEVISDALVSYQDDMVCF